jgi:hypothetical protein
MAYLALSLVGSVAMLWGPGRKLWLGQWSAPSPSLLASRPGQALEHSESRYMGPSGPFALGR